jgi:hypothetical protein
MRFKSLLFPFDRIGGARIAARGPARARVIPRAIEGGMVEQRGAVIGAAEVGTSRIRAAQ